MLIVSDEALGTPESVWSAPGQLDVLPTLDPGTLGRVLVVAPHPDDEVLGVGGTLRAAARLGASIELVAVTAGEGSHPGSAWTGQRLARRRRAERGAALDLLGLDGVVVHDLGLPDGGVSEREDHLAFVLAGLLGSRSTCLATWRHDGHPDHEAVGRAAASAAAMAGARLFEYPIWAWHWGRSGSDLPLDRAWRIELSEPDLRAKVMAVGAFGSQIRPVGDGPAEAAILPPAVVRRFQRPFEVLFESREHAHDEDRRRTVR